MRTSEQISSETSETRAQIGRDVELHLQLGGGQSAAGRGMTLWFVEEFLGAGDCAFLIDRIEANRQPSILLSDKPEQAFRTSESGNLDRWDERVRAIDLRICALLGLDEAQGETLQGQRYGPGQYFRTHHDWFHTDQAYWADQQSTGGQRTWTAMIYLNRPEAGGETSFDAAGLMVPPKPGLLIAWNNMDPNGAPNLYAAHEGREVADGVKYIVTKWFREGNWL
jgi:prolyl 4-hydroxylase